MKKALPLEIDNLSYGSRDPVFQKASLAVAPGEFVTLLIEEGPAKSTLIDCLLGNLKPTTGSIRFWGQENRGFNRDFVQQRVGWMMSKKESYAPWIRVREFMLATSRLYRNWNTKLYAELVSELGADLERRMSDLTFEEMSRIRFIRALSFGPDLLVLDDITSGLVAESQKQYLQILARQKKDRGVSTLYITQGPSDVLEISDRVSALDRHGLTPDVDALL